MRGSHSGTAEDPSLTRCNAVTLSQAGYSGPTTQRHTPDDFSLQLQFHLLFHTFLNKKTWKLKIDESLTDTNLC